MSWFDRIFGLEKHDMTPTPPITMVGFPANGGILPGGVTATTALGLSSVWRCLQVLSNGVQQLEWRESRGTLDTLPLSRLVRRPQADRTRREWTSIVVNTLALYQVCYLLRLGEDAEGVPQSLYYLAPPLVQPATPIDLYGLLPISEYWVAGRRVSADRLHIIRTGLLPGIPDHLGGLIDMARVTFAAAISSENYASRFWQGGASPVTKIKTDQALTPTQADELRNEWDTKQQLGRSTAVFGLGADANPFGADITQAAAVEARRELVADIARYFGVPTRLRQRPDRRLARRTPRPRAPTWTCCGSPWPITSGRSRTRSATSCPVGGG